MSTQLRIRRGTKSENNVYTGASGELTYDTETATIRIHDGITPGGKSVLLANTPVTPDDYDYVVESSAPGVSPWYRQYKSGWVEQGGRIQLLVGPTTPKTNITLPIPMRDKDDVNSASLTWNAFGGGENTNIGSLYTSTQTVLIISAYNSSTRTDAKIHWVVCGYAA